MKRDNNNRIILLVVTLITVSLTSCIRYHYNSNIDFGKYLSKFISEFYDNDNIINDKNKGIASISSVTTNIDIDTQQNHVTNHTGKIDTLSKYQLPLINEVIYGFRVNGIFDYNEKNAKIVEFEHIKTGAKVLLISNDDIDKCACIGLNTLTDNDKGIPHVFEHATLAGSDKYHGSNLFFDMSNRTYTTYLNAFTSQFTTCYPIGSLSDEQLFACYKVYLDGILKPDILKDERILEREAYRYILANKNDKLQLSGVVYSEMSAYESNIYVNALYNANKTLLNGSVLSSITGGVTSEITKIQHSDLIEFHNEYYHPSNMVITLYGDLDYKKYLEYTNNEYFVNYEKKYINKEDKYFKKNSKFIEKVFDFPVASNSTIDNGSIIVYSILCDGMSAYESGLFSVILNELQRGDGPLSREVSDKLYKAMFYVDNCLASPKPNINIIFQNVNETDKDQIKIIVENALNDIIENGISEDVLNSYIDNNDMTTELVKDSHGFTDQILNFYDYVFRDNGENILSYLEFLKGICDLKDRYNDGTLDKLIKKYFVSNENSSLAITIPRLGLLEQNNIQNEIDLENFKLNLNDYEIDNLITKNKEYDKWVEDNNKYSDIDKVRVASVSGLEEYEAKCYAYEENIEGIHFIRSDIDDIKFFAIDLLFDASGIEFDDIHKLKLLSNLFLYLPTENYPDYTLSAEFDKNSYSYGSSIYVNHYWNGGYKPYLDFSVMALNKNIDKIFELLDELMFKTEFNDIDKLRNFINQEYNECLTNIKSDPSNIADNLMNCKINSDYEYDEYINGMAYFKFIKTISKYTDDELKNLLTECKTLLDKVYNKNQMVCEIISDLNYISSIKENVLNLVAKIDNKRISVINYGDKIKQEYVNTAVVLNTNVQYNYIGIPYKDNGLEFDAKFYIIDALVNNKILYPEFRVKKSSYGSYVTTSRIGSYIYTYRDPELKASFDTFNKIPEMLNNLKVDDVEFEDYKLSAYSSFSYPLTKLGAATIAINEILEKCNEKRPDRFVKYMNEIKNAQLSDLNDLKNRFTLLIDNGLKITIGSKEQIENNCEYFDEIIYEYFE